MAIDLILGTAGHIDHGKTALVEALTGVNTDRLPEEKERGITIELGYARLDLAPFRIGIVDVPGHERFVRNMLAGATGVDIALLVVAADDSVMPQTREHLEILRLLDLQAGIIAITKCDVAKGDWIDLVELEIRELVQGTFLESAAIVRTSAVTGEGIDALQLAIARQAEKLSGATADTERQSLTEAPFRMAIDRTFSIAGHGTVVTGSVASGSARAGDALTIEPGGVHVRVRGLQSHDESAEAVRVGQRAALNLAGVHHGDIARGQELAADKYLIPTRLLTVRFELSPTAPRPLKNRSRARIHLGTTDVHATIVLLDVNSGPASPRAIAPGETALAQLHLSDDVVATWRQPFVVRWMSPVETIGGGVVLQPNARRIRPKDESAIAMALALASDDPAVRIASAIYFGALRSLDSMDLFRETGVAEMEPIVASLLRDGTLESLSDARGESIVAHTQYLEELGNRVSDVLFKMHAAEPLRQDFETGDLRRRISDSALLARFWPAITASLVRRELIEVHQGGERIALRGAGPQLSKGEQTLLDEMNASIREAGVEPPSIEELTLVAAKNKASVMKLLELAEANGALLRINKSFFMHFETIERIKKTLRDAMGPDHGMTLSEIRELLGTTRKYAVPICEYLDAEQFTVRRQDQRFLA